MTIGIPTPKADFMFDYMHSIFYQPASFGDISLNICERPLTDKTMTGASIQSFL